uniref:Uncharacterized protein n=1 Tax=Tanacetum cinerariifolium TaxID=118510 RepID=A0A6L2LDW4_TANCI|nr:hypothetical protein [Tanacetum cinerariifolium]
MDEFLAEKDKSRKRRREDQDPPPHPPDLDLNKRRRHDTGASGLSQPQAPQSSAWKNSDTRDAPLSVSKQQSDPHAEQPVEDIPIPDTTNISNSVDTDSKFYIDRHIADSSRKVVRTRICILNVVSIKSFFCYGYDYLKEITLRRADYQEYTVAKKDFKSLFSSDFEDLNLLLLQGHLNHLSGLEKRFEYKHNYTIIDSPRAVVFPVGNNEWKIMRFNKIYKFSDGTLMNIVEALYFRVKDYKVNQLKPGMKMRFWTDKDVARRKVLRIILVVLPEHPSDTYVFTMKMEILLEPTSNKLMVAFGRHYGNTHDLGSFGEETDKITNQRQDSLRFKVSKPRDGIIIYTRHRHTSSSDDITTSLDDVSLHRLNSDLKDSTL